MSKVTRLYSGFEDTLAVSAATITTGWKAGQLARLCDDGAHRMQLASGSAVYGVILDGSTELAAPPSGSLVTVLFGSSLFLIDGSDDVAAGVTTYVYETEVASGHENDLLYCSYEGKWATTSGSKQPVGYMTQVPAAGNNYTLGVRLL